jgi:hypothetical protein
MPSRCRCGEFAQSKGDADGYHRGLSFNRPTFVYGPYRRHGSTRRLSRSQPTTNAINRRRFDDHVFSTFRHTIHRGTTGHSGQQNPRFDVRRNLCRAMRHFYRLLVGWTRSTGVKWFRLARRNGQTLAVKRYERGSTSAACRS